MKKLALLSLSVVGLLGMVSCGPNTVTKPNTNVDKPTAQTVAFKKMAETSAISSINMLNTPTGNVRRAKLTEDDKQLVLKNLNLVDELLQDDPIKTEVKPVEETDPYYGQYTEYYTVEIKKLDGKVESYVFYYKETLVDEKEEKAVKAEQKPAENNAETPADKPADKPAEEVEIEKNSKLDGVIIYNKGKENEEVFLMHGDKEVETEGTEQEVEFSFKITEKENQKNFVLVKQEAETNSANAQEKENEYMYKKHVDGKLVESVKINYEVENNETEYFVSTMKDKVKTVYAFKFEKENGKELIKVRINENGTKVVAKLEVVDGNYVFLE